MVASSLQECPSVDRCAAGAVDRRQHKLRSIAMGSTGRLLAIDWGSSSLRGALLDSGGNVLDERSRPSGMLHVARGDFDAAFEAAFGDWMDLPGTRCLMTGMVGSRQGWVEADYVPCPAGLDDFVAYLRRVGTDASGKRRDIAIVPGACCEHDGVPDVLRGEEVKALGALELLGVTDATVVSPGTHSKWITIESGRLRGFSTAMSGEMFALLRRHSILARSMPDADGDDDALDGAAFDEGVRRALASCSLLQTAFSVRTLALFDRMPVPSLASYLSGLVIGDELRCRPLAGAGAVVLTGAPALTVRFARALALCGVVARTFGEEVVWRGLAALDRRRLEMNP
jgi:2-dehydro-3-deoxygalactonokinase